MEKITYTNEMPYIYDASHKGAHFLINGSDKYKNYGETVESIAKYHRGIYTEVNPNTKWNTGSDIESEKASVKSRNASLATMSSIKGETASEKIKTYFKEVASEKFIYIAWDRRNEKVTEYHMNKSEFGAFINACTSIGKASRNHGISVRFSSSTSKSVKFLEQML